MHKNIRLYVSYNVMGNKNKPDKYSLYEIVRNNKRSIKQEMKMTQEKDIELRGGCIVFNKVAKD